MLTSGGVASQAMLSEPDSELQLLRVELKRWEKAFSLENAGRKASRDDIKKDAIIAQRYKDYNRLRNGGKSKEVLSQRSPSTTTGARKRKHNEATRDNDLEDGFKRHQSHPAQIDPYDAPFSLTPVATRTFVGPTPQKNGQVLGLFDLLSPSNVNKTPSKTLQTSSVSRDNDLSPSRARCTTAPMSLSATPTKPAITPRTGSNRQSTLNFVTPSTRRFIDQVTPSSRMHGNDETPEFLRRDSRRLFPTQPKQADQTEHSIKDPSSWSPIAVRMPPRAAGRGLSALVKGLRNMEEDRLDEEMDLLREMEGENQGLDRPPIKSLVQVENSQIQIAVDLPLGADGDNGKIDTDDAMDDNLGRNGGSLKVWKKRGQKRTTRKVNIKPTATKWKPEASWNPHEPTGEHSLVLDVHGSEELNVGEDDKVELRRSGIKSQRHGQSGKEKPQKMVKPTDHANFRALKIQKKGTKFKGKGRFGRR